MSSRIIRARIVRYGLVLCTAAIINDRVCGLQLVHGDPHARAPGSRVESLASSSSGGSSGSGERLPPAEKCPPAPVLTHSDTSWVLVKRFIRQDPSTLSANKGEAVLLTDPFNPRRAW